LEPKILLEKMRMSLGDGTWTALAQLSESEEGDPFKVLISTILSHRTRDEKTAEATRRLFGKIRGVDELAEADPKDVVELIRGVGFYNVKSRRIIEVARIIKDRYGGRVPDNIDELLKIPSVGRKTANCVLVYGYKIEAIPVDTHVHRVANRIGIAHSKNPDGTERQLEAYFPKEYWLEVNDLFVRFGKSVCKPVGPKHEICLLRSDCEYYNSIMKHGKHE
jgi:endonuclease-3